MTKIALVGCGFVGRAWAISFARAGFGVALWDRDAQAPKNALGFIADILEDLEKYELLNGQTPQQILDRLTPFDDMAAALEGAVHIQESVAEDIDVKRKVFAQLDAVAPADAVIASSSSALLPSAFSKDIKGRERCLVVHPINPPYLIPAVEIVPAPWTSKSVVERTRKLLVAAEHAPIVMAKELDGFVMNRLQGALLEEAFRLVADGYATIEDVDVGIRDGLALRWSFMGPFETIDLNAPGGVRDYAERYQGIYKNLFEQMQRRVDWEGPVLDVIEADRRKVLKVDELQDRQLWRDRRLIALAAHKLKSDKEIGK